MGYKIELIAPRDDLNYKAGKWDLGFRDSPDDVDVA